VAGGLLLQYNARLNKAAVNGVKMMFTAALKDEKPKLRAKCQTLSAKYQS